MSDQVKANQELIEEISALKQKIKKLEQLDSEHKQLISALRESEERYRIIAENSIDIINILDMNLHFTYSSPSVLRIRGFTIEEAMEETLEHVLTSESLKVVYENFAEEMALEASGTADPNRIRIMELEEYKKDGSTIWVESTMSYLRDKDGMPTGILAVSRDITDRKQFEKTLGESEHALRTILDNTHDAIFVHAVDGKILDVNMKMLELYGVTREQCLQLSIAEDFSTSDNPIDQLQDRWNRVLKGESMTFEWKARRPNDGSSFNVEVALKRIILGNRAVVLANVRDISIRKAFEKRLRQSQKMEAIGLLAGGVAHDFNNILQAIIGYTDMVLFELGPDDKNREKLMEVYKAGQRAATLTRQLLAFSRRQVLQLVQLNLNQVIEEVLKMLHRLIGENIELVVNPSLEIWTVNADRSQMEQVLMNLCVNARDSMPEGGCLSIETDNFIVDADYCAQNNWNKPGRYVRLCVADTGCGMDPETRSKVFEPFFTTKEEGKGTGLGLATVYGIVSQHEGMININSEVGKGSVFSIYLPAIEQTDTEIIPAPQAPVPDGTETILLAEDNEQLRDLSMEILKQAGYRVLTAVDGDDALRIYHDHGNKVDLLILDVMMPKKGGRIVYDEISAIRSDIRCLFMSGYSEDAVHTNFILDKKLNLIQKPFKIDELLRTVRHVLDL